jgi:hypothetical protein
MNDYVPDNPLFAEPADEVFDEDENLVKNVRGLLNDRGLLVADMARHIATFDEEVGDPGATLAALLILGVGGRKPSDAGIAEAIARLRKG